MPRDELKNGEVQRKDHNLSVNLTQVIVAMIGAFATTAWTLGAIGHTIGRPVPDMGFDPSQYQYSFPGWWHADLHQDGPGSLWAPAYRVIG